MKKYLALVATMLTAAVAGLVVLVGSADAKPAELRAELEDPTGRAVGTVRFEVDDHTMQVEAKLRRNSYVSAGAFHGFHLHANADPSNGSGCQADPKASSATWFVSADGHFAQSDQKHGKHDGDLPSPLVMADGTAKLSFSTDRIDPTKLAGLAVVLHADPDNFGNVPVGAGPTRYTPGSEAATALTARTGNAGDRVACGLVERKRS